jgi:hypothetical protein
MFDLALDESEWSASRHGRFIPGERDPQYPLDKRLGGPQTRSRNCGGEKDFLPLSGIQPQSSSPTQSLY